MSDFGYYEKLFCIRHLLIAKFALASAFYLHLGLTEEQQACLVNECIEIYLFYKDTVPVNTSSILSKLHEMNSYLMLANKHLILKKYADAIVCSKKSLDVAKEIGYKATEMSAYTTLGKTYFCLKRYQDAIVCIKKSLDIAVEIDDKVAEMHAFKILGDAYFSLEKFGDAIINSKKCLNIASRPGDKIPKMKASLTLGNAYLELEKYNDAIVYSETCLNNAKEIDDKVTEMNAYWTLGDAFFFSERYDDAKAYCKTCLEIAKAENNEEAEMNAYRILGKVYLLLKKYDDAIDYSKKCLDIAEKNGVKVAQACMILGDAYLFLEKFHDAEVYSRKYLNIAQETRNKILKMKANFMLGNVYLNLGKYDDAINYNKKCLDIAKEIGHKVFEMSAYSTLGKAYFFLKRYNDAIIYSKKCLDVAQEARDKPIEACAYISLGKALSVANYCEDAMENHEKCIGIATKTKQRDVEIDECFFIASLHFALGELNDSLLYAKKCKDIAKETNKPSMEMKAFLLSGRALISLSRYDDSLSCLTEGLKIAETLKDKDRIKNFKFSLCMLSEAVGLPMEEYGSNWIDFAYISENENNHGDNNQDKENSSKAMVCYVHYLHHRSQKEYQKAILCLHGAIKLLNSVCDPLYQNSHSMNTIPLKMNISDMCIMLGQYDKAIQNYQDGLDLALHLNNKHYQALCHFGLGTVYCKLEQTEKAEESLKESIDCFDFMFDHLGDNDRFKIAIVDKYNDIYKMLLKVLIERKKNEDALLLADRFRAKALKDILVSNYGIKKEDITQYQYTDVQALSSSKNYAILFYSMLHEELYTFLVQTESRIPSLVRFFKHCDVFIDKFIDKTFDEMRVREVENCEDRSVDALFDSKVDQNVELEQIELLVEQFLRQLKEKSLSTEQCRSTCDGRDPGEPSENSDESCMSSSLEILYRKLLHNVMSFVNQDEIVIIPDGPLNKVPFAALRDPETGRYLSETKRIRLAPSLATLKHLEELPEDQTCKTDALIIGDPLVGKVIMDGEERYIKELEGAREEAAEIALILMVRPLLTNEATKPAVIKKLQQGASIVHIAAHGSLTKGAIVLAPSPEIRATKIPDEEDYMLTMADVQKTQVRAQLVVLSCCHSGRGEIKSEGVIGICRAFLASGARAVVASLWAVSDSATRKFMKIFYKYLKKGNSASTSLHLTMHDMRQNPRYSEPKYWAPFFLMGADVTVEFQK